MKHKKLLLLHGALGASQQFDALQALLNQQFEIHTLHFEGHGGEESAQDFSIERFTQNVIRYLDEKKIATLSIFGYSMGGYVSLNLALQYPQRVEKIITLGTKFNWTPETALKETKLLNPDKIEEKIPHFAKYLHELHQPLDWKEVVQKTAHMMLELANGKALTNSDFQKINVPTIIGLGDQDNMVTVEESTQVCSQLPSSLFQLLENVPHPLDKIDHKLIANYITTHL